MNIIAQTLSIVTGSKACNANCPYCVSKMTPCSVNNFKEINWRNFEIACDLAKMSKVNTVLLTGKGEPCLYPSHIMSCLLKLMPYNFPFVEVQTNGIELMKDSFDTWLKQFYTHRLTHIAISIVHYEDSRNKKIFGVNYNVNLPYLIKKLHSIGFTVRLTCISIKDYIDNAKDFGELVIYAKDMNVKQLTIRPVTTSEFSVNKEVLNWINSNPPRDFEGIQKTVDVNGQLLLPLAHGANIYQYRRQNVCVSSALTRNPDSNEIRQLIYFPDGMLAYDWQYEGAVLL